MSRAAMIKKKCKCCKQPMTVRLADHKRGWGKFCSKSCKAIEQTRRTGRANPDSYRRRDIDHECHPFSSDGLGQW